MAFSVKNPEADRVVRDLAQLLGVGLTEAVRIAVGNELKELEGKKIARSNEGGDPGSA